MAGKIRGRVKLERFGSEGIAVGADGCESNDRYLIWFHLTEGEVEVVVSR